jgi:signal transduction histidine kinase
MSAASAGTAGVAETAAGWVVASVGEGEPGDPLVIVATETDEGLLIAGVDDGARAEAVATTVALLLIAVPLLIALVAVTCWVVVGRALRPVERVRQETEQISGDDLSRRVADPATHDEISELATTMNLMLDRLERSQSRQRRFVADASHELRSPLSSLRQNAEIARDYPGRVDPRHFATTVAEDSERLADLVDGLLVLSRADEQNLRPVFRSVDLDDLALTEASRLRSRPGTSAGQVAGDAERVPLVVDASGVSAARVGGDASMLERVLRNLGDNAARHARSRVTISTSVVGGRAVLVVSDDGVGIPEPERERVFERFVRLDEARSRDRGGSGLGLAIVRELVAAHGGTITVETSPQGGALFRVSLPVRAE